MTNAVDRVLATNQRLREKSVEEASKVSKAAGDQAAGKAMRSALEDHDSVSSDYCKHIVGPEGPCAICDAPPTKPQSEDPSRHVLHVHVTWGGG